MNLKTYYSSKQLVLALDRFNKLYSDCNYTEKNAINSIIKENILRYETKPYIIEDRYFELREYMKSFISINILNKKKLLSRDKIAYTYFIKNGFEREYDYVYYTTFYLDMKISISERLYHIMNDMYSLPNCENCENVLKFIKYGCGYNRFCCISCSKNINELERIGIYKPNKATPLEKSQYYTDVRRYTRRTYVEYKHIINPMDLRIGRNGDPGAYQLDHKIPIIIGYLKQIHPEIIGSLDNLQILHWTENNYKSDRDVYKLSD